MSAQTQRLMNNMTVVDKLKAWARADVLDSEPVNQDITLTYGDARELLLTLNSLWTTNERICEWAFDHIEHAALDAQAVAYLKGVRAAKEAVHNILLEQSHKRTR